MDDHNPSDHHEAAIVMLKRGPRTGEYVACCASSKCGYVGEFNLKLLKLIEQLPSLPNSFHRTNIQFTRVACEALLKTK